jgi:hypothetical protein
MLIPNCKWFMCPSGTTSCLFYIHFWLDNSQQCLRSSLIVIPCTHGGTFFIDGRKALNSDKWGADVKFFMALASRRPVAEIEGKNQYILPSYQCTAVIAISAGEIIHKITYGLYVTQRDWSERCM